MQSPYSIIPHYIPYIYPHFYSPYLHLPYNNPFCRNNTYNKLTRNSVKFHMPKRAEQDIRRRIDLSGGSEHIDQLCLDGIPIHTFTPTIRRLLEGCPKLQYLTMNDCELQSLEGFPGLRRLIGLELADNQISDHDLPYLAAVSQVNFLALGNNRLSSISSFKHLSCLPELEIIQLQENECCQEEQYREGIFGMLPSVKVVDRLDRSGRETEEENPSEYISNLGNSRLDLLELLEGENEGENEGDDQGERGVKPTGNQEHQGQNGGKEDVIRTATSYAQSGIRTRKNSLQQAMTANPSHFSIFHLTSSLSSHYRASTPQKGFLFMRADTVTNSDSDSQDGLIKSFKRKYHKKE